jgi:hypothetical protein
VSIGVLGRELKVKEAVSSSVLQKSAQRLTITTYAMLSYKSFKKMNET